MCKVTYETNDFYVICTFIILISSSFVTTHTAGHICLGDHYLLGKVFQSSLYTDPTMLSDAWTTYDESLLCKNHDNIKKLIEKNKYCSF
jgi:hypothetical protein